MNNEIKDLLDMFGKAFPEKTITKIYDENNRNMEHTITKLLDLTESVEGSKKSNDNQGKKATMTSAKQTTTNTKSNVNQKNKKIAISKTSSLPSYQKFREEFIDLLSREEIEEVWREVQRLCWGSKLTATQHYDMARSNAEQRVLEKFEKTAQREEEEVSSGVLTAEEMLTSSAKEAADFATYNDLFHNLIPQRALEEIWKNASSSSSSSSPKSSPPKPASAPSSPSCQKQSDRSDAQQERMELAILTALNYLEERDRQQAKIRDDPTISSSETSLSTYLATQEFQRATNRSKKHTSSSLSQEQRDAALAYMLDLFASASPALTPQRVTEELIKANYDISLTIENICNSTLKKGNYSRDLSYAEAVFTGKQLTQANPSPSIAPPPTTNNFPHNHNPPLVPTSNIHVIPEGKHPDRPTAHTTSYYPDYYLRNSAFQEKRWQFSFHFLQVFQRKNPSIFVNINEDGELIYEGSQQERSCNPRDLHQVYQQMLPIRIDFHGLPVHHALQIVESSLDYYRSFESGGTVRCVALTFIVGLGLHSAGGVARLRPAVERFLNEQCSSLRSIVSGGEITVTIPIRG